MTSSDRDEIRKVCLPTWPWNDTEHQGKTRLALLFEWLEYFPYYSSVSTPLKNASLICIFDMVISVRYRYNNLLKTHRISGWKFQVDSSVHEMNTRLEQSIVGYHDYVVSSAIVLPKAEFVLQDLWLRLYVNEDYPEVKALPERNGINEVEQLLLGALISGFKTF